MQQSPKVYCVLAEVDLSILKQSREFVDYYLAPPSQSAALMQVGTPRGASLYVLEDG